LIIADKSQMVSGINGEKIFKIMSANAFKLEDTPATSCAFVPELKEITAYISSGIFYYSENSNIALNSQHKEILSNEEAQERADTFVWNQHLLDPIVDLASQIPQEQSNFLLESDIFSKIVKGFFKSTSKSISSIVYEIGVYTRIGKKKAGTRFNSRGLDDEANVSIFGETEVIISSEKFTFSYVILRGSVPVFWDQQGVQIGPSNVQITRAPLATQPSFDRHFESLIESYGLIHALNLLSCREGSVELLLTDAYEYHTNNSIHAEQISFTSFDLNKILQKSDKDGIELLFQHVSRDILVFGFHVSFEGATSLKTQKGVFRVNCLDCLDRTNLAQDFIVRKVVDLFFRNYLLGQNFKQIDSIRIQSAVSRLFADNGDAISLIYSGTRALKTAFTRKGQSGFFDYFDDLKKSAHRMYCGNFTDKSKQATLDYILGNNSEASKVEFFNPISKNVQTQLKLRYI
jgi:synaptojanin